MRILMYTGKGGVGKTSVAAATAGRLAARGRRTLVLSTDAAHSLADSLDRPLGPDPVAVTEKLWGAGSGQPARGRAQLGRGAALAGRRPPLGRRRRRQQRGADRLPRPGGALQSAADPPARPRGPLRRPGRRLRPHRRDAAAVELPQCRPLVAQPHLSLPEARGDRKSVV